MEKKIKKKSDVLSGEVIILVLKLQTYSSVWAKKLGREKGRSEGRSR